MELILQRDTSRIISIVVQLLKQDYNEWFQEILAGALDSPFKREDGSRCSGTNFAWDATLKKGYVATKEGLMKAMRGYDWEWTPDENASKKITPVGLRYYKEFYPIKLDEETELYVKRESSGQ